MQSIEKSCNSVLGFFIGCRIERLSPFGLVALHSSRIAQTIRPPYQAPALRLEAMLFIMGLDPIEFSAS
jgi:hypothetical protein